MKYWILVMLVLSLFIALTLGYSLKTHHINDHIATKAESTYKLFSKLLESEAKFMEAQLSLLAENQSFIDAWKARDRNVLFEKTKGIFDKIQSNYGISHFYFIEPDKSCFLRVHAPDRFGDKINRYTLESAMSGANISSGLEIGLKGAKK